MIRNDLDFFIHLGVLSDLDEFVKIMLYEKYENDEKKYKEYDRLFRLLMLCMNLKNDNLEKFDWKYLIENGKFCQHDFAEDRFKDWLLKEGYNSYEEALKIYEQKDNERKLSETTK